MIKKFNPERLYSYEDKLNKLNELIDAVNELGERQITYEAVALKIAIDEKIKNIGGQIAQPKKETLKDKIAKEIFPYHTMKQLEGVGFPEIVKVCKQAVREIVPEEENGDYRNMRERFTNEGWNHFRTEFLKRLESL